jgi:hypothetical protein
MRNCRDELHKSLVAMTVSKSDCTRVIVSSGHAYVIVERRSGARDFELLAPASLHLDGAHKLSQEGAQWLRGHGFERSRGSRDFRSTVPATIPHTDLTDQIEEILGRAYGVEVSDHCARTEHDDRAHPSNGDVIEAMRRLSTTRDHGDRLRLYNSLVNATLLVPFSPTADESMDGSDAWCELDGDRDKPVFAVFTDWDHLRMWSLRSTEYQPLHGAEFFEELMETPAVGLRINPRGDVGGELFRHEFEMIAKGIRQWRGRS